MSLKDLANEKKKSGGELRRRAVVLLSDGEDTSSLVTDGQVLELAKKTEINVYPILLRQNRASGGNRPAFSQAEHLLTTLARDTGGRHFVPNSISELDKVYAKIVRHAGGLVRATAEIERTFGIPVVNRRIAVSPIASVAAGHGPDDLVRIADTLDRAAGEASVDGGAVFREP